MTQIYSLQWEAVVCLPVISLSVGLLFIFRLFPSVRSCLYVQHEKQLAETLAAGIEENVKSLASFVRLKRSIQEMNHFLENARQEKESFNIPSLTDSSRKVKKANMTLM